MRRLLAGFLGAMILTTALAACTVSSSVPADKPIMIDLIPTQVSQKFEAQIKRLGELLSQESGLQIEMRIATDYAAVVEAMRFGRSDISYFGPFTYVVANAQSDAQAFITQNIKGKPYYNSYAIVRKDSPIQNLDDKGIATLKGMTVALGDPGSTSSSQIPQLAMQNAGLDREKDLTLQFTGAHDAVLKTVVAKRADIGFLDSAIFEGSLQTKFPEDFNAVRIVWKSTELYQYPWAHRKDLDQAVVKKLQDAFLKITDKDALEPFGADSFVIADDKKYDAVRDAAKALKIDLKSYSLIKK